MDYKVTIGLEIHAELKTETKMFCDSKNDPDETNPNINICPVCLGYPGTLPTINKEAVRNVLRVGISLGGKLAEYTEFDRKNYFYPDIPKGYQISQYEFPLVSGGELNGVKITRIHLEEDTARSTHQNGDRSLIDYNRAGIPLMELVTEPVINSALQAVSFAKELQLLLQYLKASDANLEKGEMRVEANISISKDSNNFGTKVEVKNLNSFKAVEKAIEYEVSRQAKLLEEGGEVVQETRGWDEVKQKTFSQRNKEDSHDYRYFPDPDLKSFNRSNVKEFSDEALAQSLPELPEQKRLRYKKDYSLKDEDIEIYVRNPLWSIFLEDVIKGFSDKGDISKVSNYITSDLFGLNKDKNLEPNNLLFSSKEFSDLVKMIVSGDLSSRGAKDVLAIMYDSGGDPKEIAKENKLIQSSDESEIKNLVQKVIVNNTKTVEEYKSGKTSVLQFLIGQGIKESGGSANPQVLRKIMEETLNTKK